VIRRQDRGFATKLQRHHQGLRHHDLRPVGIVRTCDDDLAGVIACVTAKSGGCRSSRVGHDQPRCYASVKVQIHHDGAAAQDQRHRLDVGWTGFATTPPSSTTSSVP
jgi:hypothetical protein